MLCGRGRRCTSTGSPAQNNTPSFWLALPSPPQLGTKKPPIVDQNLVAHHAVRSGSTLHLHREPCSEQQAHFLACPTLPPTVGSKGTPHCRSEFGCPSWCAIGLDAAPSQGALLRTTGPVFGLPYPPPHIWAQGNPHCRSQFGCPSYCSVGVDAAPPQGALLRTTGPVFGLTYPPPPQLSPREPPIVDQNSVANHAVPSGRRCTSTGSPVQNNRPSFWPALPSPQSWAQGNPPFSIRIWLPIMLRRRGRDCTSTGSPAQNNTISFWPALPSPPQLGSKEPPIVNQNLVAHNAVWSRSTLHLHRKPCSEQHAKFLACLTLPPTVGLKGTPHCRSEFGCPSCFAVGVDAAPPQGALLRKQAQFLICTTLPSTVGPKGTPHCRSEFGCPSCCAVGLDAAPPQGALLRTTRLVFGLPYPPRHSWAQKNPPLSIRIWLPIMLCGRARRCTSTGSPAQNNTPSFWPALPFPPQLGSREPPIVDQNLVAHHALRSGSTLHLHRERCSENRPSF